MRPAAVLGFALAVSGCAYMSVGRAESTCVEDAKAARGPTGTIALGTTSEGAQGKADVTISSDWVFGRNPEEIYNSCVLRRSGQAPVTPLASQPGWRR